MKTTTNVVAVLCLLACVPHGAHAQRRSPTSRELQELKAEIQKLREEQEGMRKDLQEIKRLLEQVGSGPQNFMSIADEPSLGHAGAKVVLVDFSDYQ